MLHESRATREALRRAVKAAKTTPLLSGAQWVGALRKAPAVSAQFRPAR